MTLLNIDWEKNPTSRFTKIEVYEHIKEILPSYNIDPKHLDSHNFICGYRFFPAGPNRHYKKKITVALANYEFHCTDCNFSIHLTVTDINNKSSNLEIEEVEYDKKEISIYAKTIHSTMFSLSSLDSNLKTNEEYYQSDINNLKKHPSIKNFPGFQIPNPQIDYVVLVKKQIKEMNLEFNSLRMTCAEAKKLNLTKTFFQK
jgi:hypothetical protein